MDNSEMSQFQNEGIIEEIRCNGDVCRVSLFSPDISRSAKPGQFVMVKTGENYSNDPLLRRPFSIHSIKGDTLVLAFKVVGRGTQWLSEKTEGGNIGLLGPLGRGFDIQGVNEHYLVGGGMGIAPLLFLAERIRQLLPQDKIIVLLGAKTEKELLAVENFRNFENVDLQIATDDGSVGRHGLVTDLIPKSSQGQVYCCGPWPMMKAVAKKCNSLKLACQVSLETMMACGIGACLGCAVEGVDFIKSGYLHVCKDGPVFDAKDIWL